MIRKQPILKDGKITLKRLKAIHAKQLFKMRSDKDLCRKAGLNVDKDVTETLIFIIRVADKIDNHEFYYWGIFKDRTLIGVISLWGSDYLEKSGELGYFIGSDFLRQGYMSRAIKLVTNYLLSETDFEKIYAYVETSNLASISLVEKLGFIKEGKSIEEDMADNFVAMYKYAIKKPIK